jgi:hypothetical protein
MRTRRFALLAVLALLALPSSALAQSAGDDQYTNPLPQTQAPSPSGSNSGSGGGSGGGGSGSTSPGTGTGSGTGANTSANTPSSTDTTTSNDTTSSSSGSDSSAKTLPRTGLPLGILAALGLLFTFSGRGLRRASEEPAPDPYADRTPEVPASSPVARAARRRSD